MSFKNGQGHSALGRMDEAISSPWKSAGLFSQRNSGRFRPEYASRTSNRLLLVLLVKDWLNWKEGLNQNGEVLGFVVIDFKGS